MNVKYKTKNINTYVIDDFLAIINQTRANINSSNNLRLIATRLWKIRLSGSFDWPLKKIQSVRIVMAVNESDKTGISISEKPTG